MHARMQEFMREYSEANSKIISFKTDDIKTYANCMDIINFCRHGHKYSKLVPV